MNAPTQPAFTLVDHHGRAVTEADYRGRWSLVLFGFTHCRVVCPRALTRVSAGLALLEPLGRDVAALYITVDPDRDTPEVMRAFLEAHHPRFTGLTGPTERIDAAKAAFRVFARRRADADDPDGYAVPHTAMTYVLDPTGHYHSHFGDACSAEQIADAVRAAMTAHRTPN